jgi:anaerobic dimethyl sulfoxide reductase subunit B (iron-sulfur subunit)
MRALDFGSFDEMTEKYGSVAQVFPLPHPGLTGPGMIIKPHKDAVKASSGQAVVNIREDL